MSKKIIKKEKMVKVKPLVTNDVAKERFIKSIKKQTDGANDYPVVTFLRVIDFVIASKRSFTLSDLQTLSKPFGLEPQTINDLAEKWIDCMVALNKCTVLDGSQTCYDEKVVVIIA